MNTWGNEQYNMQMMANMAMPGIMPGMIPPAIVPPFNMVGDVNQMQMQQMGALATAPQPNGQFIGPVIPEPQGNETAMATGDEVANQTQGQEKRQSRDKTDRVDRRDGRDRDRERGSYNEFNELVFVPTYKFNSTPHTLNVNFKAIFSLNNI